MNNIFCRSDLCRCGHLVTAHGFFRYAMHELAVNNNIELAIEYPCVGLDFEESRNCTCLKFMPQDNLRYLERLYDADHPR